jgi:hypothetical protein
VIVTVVFQIGMGALLVLLGQWGRRHSSELSRGIEDARERRRRATVVVRGSLACQAVGGIFVLMVLPVFW